MRCCGSSALYTRNYQLERDLIVPSIAGQPLLLLAYNLLGNALLNDEFWWLTVTKPNEIVLKEVTAIFGARDEWRRQLEEAGSSGITVHELSGIRKVPISLCAWVIVAEDEIGSCASTGSNAHINGLTGPRLWQMLHTDRLRVRRFFVHLRMVDVRFGTYETPLVYFFYPSG